MTKNVLTDNHYTLLKDQSKEVALTAGWKSDVIQSPQSHETIRTSLLCNHVTNTNLHKGILSLVNTHIDPARI